MDIELSSSVSCRRPIGSTGKLKLTRKKPDGRSRYVHIPMVFISAAMKQPTQYLNSDSGDFIGLDGWELKKTTYMGNTYLCFVHKDSKGERIPWDCFNLNEEEFAKLVENMGQRIMKRKRDEEEVEDELHLSSQDVVVTSVANSAIGERKRGRRVEGDTKQFNSYSVFKWVVKNGEEVFHADLKEYLSRDRCQGDAQKYLDEYNEQFDGHLKHEISCETHMVPSINQLLKWCYNYILSRDYTERRSRNCVGCQLSCGSQRDHMEGCLHQELVIEDVDACHWRISEMRLTRAGKKMCAFYNISFDDITLNMSGDILREMYSKLDQKCEFPIEWPCEFEDLNDM